MIKEAVDELGRVEGVRLALVVSLDGLLVSSSGRGGDQEEIVAAMSAAILGTVNRVALSAGLGHVTDVLIGATDASLQVMKAGDAVIVVVAERTANVGLVRLAMRRTAVRLRQFLAKEIAWSRH